MRKIVGVPCVEQMIPDSKILDCKKNPYVESVSKDMIYKKKVYADVVNKNVRFDEVNIFQPLVYVSTNLNSKSYRQEKDADKRANEMISKSSHKLK